MKRILIIYTLLFLCSDIHSQWILQPIFTPDGFWDVYFTDETTGIAVGSTGTIYKTTDFGETWVLKNSGTTWGIYGLHFINSTTGIAVGMHGTILKTTNTGESWVIKPCPILNDLYSVSFSDEKNGYIAGHNGAILRTGDGGETWTIKPAGLTTFFRSCAAIFPYLSYVVGHNGTILKTTTGGTNWIKQNSGTTNDLYAVQFLTPTLGMAVGWNQTILKTTNGGNTWIKQYSGNGYLSGIFMINENQAVAVGEYGAILRTEDGGAVWKKQTSPTDYLLATVFFTDPLKGIAMGHIGRIVKTINGGEGDLLPSVNITYPYTQWNDEDARDYGSPDGWFFEAKGTASAFPPGTITLVQVKINNGPWQNVSPQNGSYANWSHPINISALPEPYNLYPGKPHIIYARSKDNNNQWSPVDRNLFYIGMGYNRSDKIIGLIENKYGNDSIKIPRGSEFEVVVKTVSGGWYSGSNPVSFELHYTNPQLLEYVKYEEGTAFPSPTSIVVPDTINGKISVAVYEINGLPEFELPVIKIKFKLKNDAVSCQMIVFSILNESPYFGYHSRIFASNKITQWPGDANNNGKVEITDINNILRYWEKSGSPLIGGLNYWQGYTRAAWEVFADATTSDCDGNGLVNIKDVDKVIIFFGNEHEQYYNNVVLASNQNPPLKISNPIAANKSDEIYFDINIGSTEKPVYDLKILSFELKFDESALEYLGNEPGSFLTESGKQVIPQQEKGTVSASVYKFDDGNSGNGNIIRFRFRVKDDKNIELKFNNVLANKTDGTVQQLSPEDFSTIVAVDKPLKIPTHYSLSQNYPNPFNPVTTIKYEIPEDGNVSIKVFNTIGAEIATLINEDKKTGSYEISFNAIDLPSGVYFYTMRVNGYKSTMKMLIVK